MADISLKLQLKPKMTQIQSLTIKMLGLQAQDLTEFLYEQITDNPLLDIRYPDVRRSNTPIAEKPIDNIHSREDSLEEMLMKQLRVLTISKKIRMAAGLVIRSLDEKGFFTDDLDSIGIDYGITLTEMEQGLAVVKTLDPPGIGASGINEALLIQTRRCEKVPDHTLELLQYHYEDFLKGKWQRLRTEMEISDTELKCIRDFLKKLSLQPAQQIVQKEEFIRADMEIYTNEKGDLAIRMLEEIPDVFFREDLYASYEKQGDRKTKKYIHKARRAFLDLQAALAYRRQSIFAVVTAMIQQQKNFFLQGEALCPLNQKELAEKTGLSTSTVSRVCRDRYVLFNRRIYAIQDFFAQSYSRISDKNETDYISSRAIMEKIACFIKDEDVKHPYSDQQIAAYLQGQDILIARRTVAKFRLILGIANSNMRRHMHE
ncbi:RNA polymerase factor sigma-54 [Megasphaera paucivorans]|uniref:RNA polymerase, sigma 54 subunit, RpoN/SigL n=1 Tax=Megasphaera paucivorans TaxID=349095 RepID=A0A1H0AWW0_9FIRM|nr:RNA polymerase factor sigma-54 [Megasphaera paucivorans]SDN37934.1 RNA polymerase, sigma 54 subunit, RpoN/SigL [Megasphaera paucivorans]